MTAPEKVRALVVAALNLAYRAGFHRVPEGGYSTAVEADALLKSPAWLAAMAQERDEAYQRGYADGTKHATPAAGFKVVPFKPAPTDAPLTAADAGHELENLIVLEAWRQSDGDWWIKAVDSFIAGDRPLAVMVDTPENRAAMLAAGEAREQ